MSRAALPELFTHTLKLADAPQRCAGAAKRRGENGGSGNSRAPGASASATSAKVTGASVLLATLERQGSERIAAVRAKQ